MKVYQMDDNAITLLFAGDLIPLATPEKIYSEELLAVLQEKDFSIVNLEAPLTRSKKKIMKGGNNFKSPPESISHIVDGKFDAVSLSNNHIRDFGDQGVVDTLEICQDNGIQTVGAGKTIQDAAEPIAVSIKGKKIAFLNYSEKEFNIVGQNRPGANPFNLIDAFYQIQDTKANNDYVFVIYHGGLEYHYLPTPEIIKKFKFMVDAGADCVVAHHTHRYSGMIEYKRRPIFFGLGNFLSPTKTKATVTWRIGVLAEIQIIENEINYQFIPTKMTKDFHSTHILAGEEKQQVLDHIEDLSMKINDNKILHDYWNRVYSANADRLMNIIQSDSLLEYRLRKRLPSTFKTDFSKYKLINVLNLIRCDAHREIVVGMMEGKYKKMKRK